MQTAVAIRNLDFWLPTASIGLTFITWAVTQSKGKSAFYQNRTALLFIIAIILVLSLTRYLGPVCCLTATRPPQLIPVLIGLSIILGLAGLLLFLPDKTRAISALIILILCMFIILKSEWGSQQSSLGLRTLTGQDPSLVSSLDIRWLGFSYLAFRLLHVLRDSQLGRLPEFSLSEFVSYAIFFPSYPSGPIDRAQRFIQQDFRGLQKIDFTQAAAGGQRIVIGIFKKFVLADGLALIALNAQNSVQISSSLWTWVLLYAYGLRLYLDFSGYIDIALGLGKLLGINLPENFNKPYIKTNLTAFWNSWNITLAAWFRAYFFNPITRSMRQSQLKFPAWVIIFIGQFSTMALIGLWHGITWNYALWGVWHALGLFVHNRWSEWLRQRYVLEEERVNLHRLLKLGGWFITFNYVTLSWVWFALPSPSASLAVFKTLFGL
jgi:D-alanyl-lipoteichoic acid acyltransferase DltB (MBOAT superfamily)